MLEHLINKNSLKERKAKIKSLEDNKTTLNSQSEENSKPTIWNKNYICKLECGLNTEACTNRNDKTAKQTRVERA